MIRYTHTSMVARDVERLADFYTEVFGCVRLSPPQDMVGEALSRGSGLADAEGRGLWLRLPGYGENGPILELFQYAQTQDRPSSRTNEPGYNHISFDVSDIAATTEAVLAAGGSRLGEIADLEDENGIVTFVYMRARKATSWSSCGRVTGPEPISPIRSCSRRQWESAGSLKAPRSSPVPWRSGRRRCP